MVGSQFDTRPIFGDSKVWKRGVAGKPIKGRWDGTSGTGVFKHEKEVGFSERIAAIERDAPTVLTQAEPGEHKDIAPQLLAKVTCERKTGSLRIFVPMPKDKDADYKIECIYGKNSKGVIVCWELFDYEAPKIQDPTDPTLYTPYGVQPAPPKDPRKFIANCIANKGGLYALGKQVAPGTKIMAYVKTDRYGLWCSEHVIGE